MEHGEEKAPRPGIHLAFFSAAHDDKDVDAVIAAFQQSFRDLRADGLI
ncbi:MAG: hypothetical protein IIC64_15885 [SAR324 cluster bacterium]|nr:hypothetical protein [SAR324 cluster bacterium]